jgi:hypothetical protein
MRGENRLRKNAPYFPPSFSLIIDFCQHEILVDNLAGAVH